MLGAQPTTACCCRLRRMASMLFPRCASFPPHTGTIYQCVLVLVLVTCAVLLAFQAKLAAHREAVVPPWMRQPVPYDPRDVQDRGGQQDGRESRTERVQRIMERQIFRDDDAADHRHDESAHLPRPSSHKLLWFFNNGTEWPRPSSKLSRVAGVWPDPEAPNDDRIIAQLMYLPPGYKAEPKNINTSLKTIVLGGSWYNFLDGQALFLRDRCPVNKCRVYRGRAPGGATVDAIIFKNGYSNYSQHTGEKETNQVVRVLYQPAAHAHREGGHGHRLDGHLQKGFGHRDAVRKVCPLRPAGEDSQTRPRLQPEQNQDGCLVRVQLQSAEQPSPVRARAAEAHSGTQNREPRSCPPPEPCGVVELYR